MSVSKWSYIPSKCDGDYCPGDCDGCRKAEENVAMMEEEHDESCKTCLWGKWYTNGYDIAMMDEECGGCSESNSKWQPKPEPPKEET